MKARIATKSWSIEKRLGAKDRMDQDEDQGGSERDIIRNEIGKESKQARDNRGKTFCWSWMACFEMLTGSQSLIRWFGPDNSGGSLGEFKPPI